MQKIYTVESIIEEYGESLIGRRIGILNVHKMYEKDVLVVGVYKKHITIKDKSVNYEETIDVYANSSYEIILMNETIPNYLVNSLRYRMKFFQKI